MNRKNLLEEKQNEMLNILKKVDEVCKENGIKYILDWGTMLGAVRHKGFIPWDDDADISMLWKDYKRFLKIWNQVNDDDTYFIQSYIHDKKYPMIYAKVRSKKIKLCEPIFESIGIPEGIWIDVFPIINISDNRIMQKFQCKLVKFANFINHKYYYLSDSEWVRKNHKHLKAKQVFFRMMPDCVCNAIVKTFINIAGSVRHSKNVIELDCCRPNEKDDRKYYEDIVYVDFEDMKLPISKHWDEYLTKKYGDYMTPVKWGHDTL